MATTLLLALGATLASPEALSPDADRLLVRWQVDSIRCGAETIAAIRMAPVRPGMIGSGAPRDAAATLRFRIDATGRPLSIRGTGSIFNYAGDDLAPALAASRFAPGAAKRDCVAQYRRSPLPMADAPLADVVAYSLDPRDGPLPTTGWHRIRARDTDCLRQPRPAVLLRANPDWRKIDGTPGERGWWMGGFDLDARGRPVRIETLASSGDPALDAAGRKALAASRHVPGKRTGCFFPYRQKAAIVPAPPPPDGASFVSRPNCPTGAWARTPRLTYPGAWNRRSIEGWAIVQYDVAPWGDVGNVRALASEPAEAFGVQAEAVVRSARRLPSPTGATGCIERVHFRIDPAQLARGAE